MSTITKRWIAYENTETGWPTDAYVIVAADTPKEARTAMSGAIETRAAVASPAVRRRLFDIFIEAAQEVPDDDLRCARAVDRDRPLFSGFDS